MTKKEMAEALVNSAAWDGTNKVDVLLKNYSYAEIKEAYGDIEAAEIEYYENKYR